MVQSPGVFERSLNGCDVLVGNINGEGKSLADFVMSGVRESAVVCHERVCFKNMAIGGDRCRHEHSVEGFDCESQVGAQIRG